MKLTEKISWLMGRVQKSLFPHMNQCLSTPLSGQKERLVSILEILQVQRHIPMIVTSYRCKKGKKGSSLLLTHVIKNDR